MGKDLTGEFIAEVRRQYGGDVEDVSHTTKQDAVVLKLDSGAYVTASGREIRMNAKRPGFLAAVRLDAAINGGRPVYQAKWRAGREFNWKVRRNGTEGIIGWRIGFGASDILVAEGSAHGLQYGRRLFEDLVEGLADFPGDGNYTSVRAVTAGKSGQ